MSEVTFAPIGPEIDRQEVGESDGKAFVCASSPRSPQWPAFRREVFKDAEASGELCCVACGGTTLLQLHHKLPYHLHPNLELVKKNTMILCEDPDRLCHLRDGHSWNFRDYNPYSEEDALLHRKRIRDRLSQ